MASDYPDPKLLAELRGYLGWTPTIGVRLGKADKAGRLPAIVERVRKECDDRQQSSSVSSNTITPAAVPIGNYSQLSNWEATFWTLMERALDDAGF